MEKRRPTVASATTMLVFLSVFYGTYSFYFGFFNNIEELPLLYRILGIAEYAGDAYVGEHVSRYTQVTPYLAVIAAAYRLLDARQLLHVFFIFHVVTIGLIYYSLRKLLCSVARVGEVAILGSLLSLLLVASIGNVIPNGRWLFVSYLDPELVTYPFLFFSVSYFIERRYALSEGYFAVATVLHPLYALLLVVGLVGGLVLRYVSRREKAREIIVRGGTYGAIAVGYSFVVWLGSRQSVPSVLDPSYVMEVVRSPHHYRIPSLLALDETTLRFFCFAGFFSGVGLFLMRYVRTEKNELIRDLRWCFGLPVIRTIFQEKAVAAGEDGRHGEWFKSEYLELWVINVSLLAVLLASSCLAVVGRLPIVIEVTPYRIGTVVVVLSWTLFAAGLANRFVSPRLAWSSHGKWLWRFCIGVIVASGVVNGVKKARCIPGGLRPNEAELVSWVRTETRRDDLFLSYVHPFQVSVRTHALRPEYWGSAPLFSDSQLAWYEQFTIVYDVPEKLELANYWEVKTYAERPHVIDLRNVVRRSGEPIQYIVLPQDGIYSFESDGYTNVFENAAYRVLRTNEPKAR